MLYSTYIFSYFGAIGGCDQKNAKYKDRQYFTSKEIS